MTDQRGARDVRVRTVLATLPVGAVDPRGVTLRDAVDRYVRGQSVLVDAGRPTRYFFKHGACPVRIKDGSFEPSSDPAWAGVLEASRAALDRTIAAVGRVELRRGDRVQSLGTGWLIRDDIVVTNRHVAAEFCDAVPRGDAALSVDFLAERDVDESRERRVVAVQLAEGPDVAFFRLAADVAADPPETIIPLASAPVVVGQRVCTIGYPTRRLAHYDPREAQLRFSEPFDVKRLAPGRVTQVRADRIDHDCSTLSGNSGGVLLDVATGEAVGLHYGGARDVSNYAVPVAIVRDWLARIV